MNFEQTERKGVVREGYQILLKAEARLLLPVEHKNIRLFYENMVHACLKWAVEVHGERVRAEFEKLETIKERSAFSTQHYRMIMRCPWQSERHAAILCESQLTDQWREPRKSYHRISHIWDLSEQTLLPIPQILKLFHTHLTKGTLPFRPDGIYPEGDELVFFRNATDSAPFLEKRLRR